MTVSLRHVLEQGPVIRALGRTAWSAIRAKPGAAKPSCPGPWIEAELPPRSDALVRDYIRHVGGDPSWYRGVLPAHLFPQWGFGLAAETLVGIPYPLARVMNAGCRIEAKAPLPANEPLHVKVRLESIDDDSRRALITQRILTGTRSAPEAVDAELRAFVPLGKPEGKGEKAASRAAPKQRPTVPSDAKEIAFLRIASNAGLEFAKLTGDFNPVHWVPAYARANGFRACILHGFATLARSLEALNRASFAGDATRLAWVDVRFTRPLVLPARVGVYMTPTPDGGGLFVGDAPSGGAYLEGRFGTRTIDA